MTVMDWIAALVGLIVASTTIWALRRSPAGFFETFQTLWPMPWGKQIVIDFYGLEAVLALFMITPTRWRAEPGSLSRSASS
ncbi:MAG: hypothetical protein JRH16_12650 [Deltaproteobacteria bacterium]|nr:hypothetical protein [Deltaproteobacteria bacterium]MBW2360818.1 hypothetical protein [Deltaproteobacteria bacterium]